MCYHAHMMTVEGEAALAILPYCSNIDVVRHPELARRDWPSAVEGGDIRLTVYSELVIDVAVRMCAEAGLYGCIVTPGEHTFGPHNRSTSELMQQRLRDLGVTQRAGTRIAPEMPVDANNTYDQLQWLQSWQQKHRITTLAVLCLAQHLPRAQYIAQALGMRCRVVAVEEQKLTQQEQMIIQSFTEGNQAYEQRVYTFMRIVRTFAGQRAMGAALRAVTRWRTPNVVDVQCVERLPKYYCRSARQRVRELVAKQAEENLL